jgi:Fanconi-associated nuclease 1
MLWATLVGVFTLELFYRLLQSLLISPQRNDSVTVPEGGASSAVEDRTMSLLDYFDTQRPAVKRLKRSDSDINGSLSRETTRSDESLVSSSRKSSVIPSSKDSEDDTPAPDEVPNPLDRDSSGDSLIPTVSQTELEASLPSIKVDQEAIEEYEASRAAEADDQENEEELNLKERIDKRRWRRGRSSIYVDAFNLALETVLDEESHLFSESETKVFNQWNSLPYESQYL